MLPTHSGAVATDAAGQQTLVRQFADQAPQPQAPVDLGPTSGVGPAIGTGQYSADAPHRVATGGALMAAGQFLLSGVNASGEQAPLPQLSLNTITLVRNAFAGSILLFGGDEGRSSSFLL